jgi:hypothetical protein
MRMSSADDNNQVAPLQATAMINATDLTTIEVRTQYVQPLIKNILAKTNLSAATLGIQYHCATSSTTDDEAAPKSSDKDNDEGVIGTLYQEISLYRGEMEVDDVNSTCDINKSYAEVSTMYSDVYTRIFFTSHNLTRSKQ